MQKVVKLFLLTLNIIITFLYIKHLNLNILPLINCNSRLYHNSFCVVFVLNKYFVTEFSIYSSYSVPESGKERIWFFLLLVFFLNQYMSYASHFGSFSYRYFASSSQIIRSAYRSIKLDQCVPLETKPGYI